ncbi:MAG TPA: type II toxin-antitoxin system VapC family toxin [Propylenella sp.]
MIVDSSALIAILTKEPERDRLGTALGLVRRRIISSATLLETSIVAVVRAGDRGMAEVDRLVASLMLQVEPFTAEQAMLAREAFLRFGKGRHAARLNFGDCIAYALAKERGEPLLFKSDDFSKTDIEAARY